MGRAVRPLAAGVGAAVAAGGAEDERAKGIEGQTVRALGKQAKSCGMILEEVGSNNLKNGDLGFGQISLASLWWLDCSEEILRLKKHGAPAGDGCSGPEGRWWGSSYCRAMSRMQRLQARAPSQGQRAGTTVGGRGRVAGAGGARQGLGDF